jgi:hypothetical protein
MNNDNFTSFELLPKVRVYQGLLPDVDKLLDIMKASERDSNGQYFFTPWVKWGTFGIYSHQKHIGQLPFSDHPREQEEKYLSDRTFEAYNIALEHYKKTYNIDFPNTASLQKSSFSKYDGNLPKPKNNLAMQYHTDFIISERDMPGSKFLLTCTTYINDDYEGGEIEFYFDDKFYPYKPKAGDLMIFPSQEPYWHGVKAVNNGHKYLVRNYLVYDYDGSPEWLEKQKSYGAYRWAKMEIERIERENPLNMKYFQRESK